MRSWAVEPPAASSTDGSHSNAKSRRRGSNNRRGKKGK